MTAWRGHRLDLRKLAVRGLGALLLLGGVGLLAVTEESLIGHRAAAARHGGEMLDLGHDALLRPGLQGMMVRVCGPLAVDEYPRDPDFNLQDDTAVLTRQVAMFQWRQIDVGGAIHYEMDWVDHPVDSRRFRQAAGHANPESFPIQAQVFQAGTVRIGQFVLSDALVRALPGQVTVPVSQARMPANLAATFSPLHGALVTSGRPGDPHLGDLKVSWEAVPLQELTVLARVDGQQLEPAVGSPDGKGYDIEVGDMPLSGILADVPDAPQLVAPRRIAGIVLAVLGMLVLVWRYRGDAPDPWLAIGAGIAPAAAVAGLLWIGADRLHAMGWLALVAATTALVLWRLHMHARIDRGET